MTSTRTLRLSCRLAVALSAGLAIPLFFGKPTAAEFLSLTLLFLHAAIGAGLGVGSMSRIGPTRTAGRRKTYLLLLSRGPELLFALATVLFLFSFIYATNANMDYVQRFVATHGNLKLALNSAQERFAACLRYVPLLALDAFWIVYFRVCFPVLARRTSNGNMARRIGNRFAIGLGVWGLPLSLVSGLLFALAFPSFLLTGGMPALAYFCLVPLFLVLSAAPLGWGVFYGTFAGVLQTMVASFWLGTFNLLTLQFVTMVTIFQYIPFMFASIFVFRRARNLAFLVFPAAWTVFDWLRSMRFLGYPWGMLGASQYSIIPLIQISSLTGVWGVTFLVILSNSVIAGYITPLTSLREVKTRWVPAVVLAAAFALSLGWGIHKIKESAPAAQPAGMGRTVRLSLVQQNADPRKDDYRAVFDTLTRLTDEALRDEPDIVVWSETAFVPNIRRWSAEDPQKHELAALVRDLLAYQERSGTWLITGNDDYLLTADGSRLDYNGSVLFSPAGERVETYHKMHLVPFTEYFPFQRHLPGVYRLLQNFDAYLWEPGDRRVVFRHPRFSFSTPICFEDTFPNDVRLFVQEGAEAIVNLSNDYWSLTEAEAMQHAANAVFRAVENGRPLARASASGLTCSVDSLGRITARAPFFKECFLTVDLPIAGQRATLYTAWGDWFPAALCVAIAFLVGWSMVARRR